MDEDSGRRVAMPVPPSMNRLMRWIRDDDSGYRAGLVGGLLGGLVPWVLVLLVLL